MSRDVSRWPELARAGLIEERVSLAGLTTYRFGGPARYYAEIASRTALDRIVEALGADPVEVLVVGRGSNLVISDRGFAGLVIKLSGEFLEIDIEDNRIRAGGAVALPRLARAATKAGRAGLEFFVGVPGSVGGAITMNAGCFGSETSEWLLEADLVDLRSGSVRKPDPAGLDHRYRHSNVGAHELVVSAVFRTEPGDPGVGEAKMREITQWRKRTQPGGTYNAGSVFKNPEGDAAGRLIDAAGLKGLTVGGAGVSERHANFFVATERASAQDVYDLVERVRMRVFEVSGVSLTPEIRFAGEFDEPAGDTRIEEGVAPS